MITDAITSTANSKIKEVVRLSSDSKERRETNLTVVEGLREVREAYKSNCKINTIFFEPSIIDESEVEIFKASRVYSVSKDVYAKIAYRDTTEGIVAVVETKNLSLEEIELKSDPLIILLEQIEKPGNIGAVLRTADALSVDLVIVCDSKTDLYNPNIIRSSLGAIFSNKVSSASSQDALKWIKAHNYSLFAAELNGSIPYHIASYSSGVVLAFGNESRGLTSQIISESAQRIKIPMLGSLDSLNISVSAAIITSEAARQRGFK